MHSNTNYINNEVVKTLNELACHCSISEFRRAFNTLDDDNKQHYISTITLTQHATAMVRILNAMEKDQAVRMFYDLLKENKGFAFNTLNVTTYQSIGLFKTLFNELDSQQKEEYAKCVTKNQKSSRTMVAILNAMENQVVSTFRGLLKKDQDFAFNILDVTAHRSINLFKTLFIQLNSQQEEDYEIHLETKPEVRAQFTLRKFYSNNKNGASKLKTKNSNKDNLDNESLAQKRKRAGLDEFSKFNPGTFFPNSVTLEEVVKIYGFNCEDSEFASLNNCVIDKEIRIEPAAKHQRIL